MKKVSLLVLLVFSFITTFSQTYPVTQILGSPQTLVLSKGGLKADSSLIIPVFSDTGAANRSGYINKYPGSLIRVQSNMFIRNATATQWLQFTTSAPSIDTTSLSNRLNGKIDSIRLSGDSVYALRKTIVGGISSTTTTFQYKNPYIKSTDTSNMLVPYLRKADTSAMLSKYLRRSDTTSMLSNYLRKSTTISTILPLQGGGDLSTNRTFSIRKASASDSGYLSAANWTYFNSKQDPINPVAPLYFISGGLQIVPATGTQGGFLTSVDYNKFNAKVNISDTSSMLLPYLRKVDTTNKFVNRITRQPGKDSIIFFIGGTRYAIKDSTSGGGTGTVTAVTATYPIVSSGGTSPNISMYQASNTQDGFVTSLDWIEFDNKVDSVRVSGGVLTNTGGKNPIISSNVSANKLLGRNPTTSGAMQEITIGSGLTLSGTTLTASGGGGGGGSQNLQQTLNYGDTLNTYFYFKTNGGDSAVNLNGSRLTAPRIYDFPDSSGILALKSDLIDPVYQIDLSSANYTMSGYGIYVISKGTDSTTPYYITLPNPALLNGKKITLINNDGGQKFNALIDTTTYQPKYQGTDRTIWQIPYGMTYEFVSANSSWVSANPMPSNTQRLDIDNDSYTTTIPFGGIYKAVHAGDDAKDYAVNFPDPKKNNGERITLINTDSILNIEIIGTWIPVSKNTYGGQIIKIAPQSTYEFVSIDSQWVCVNMSTPPTYYNIDLTPSDFNIPSCGIYHFLVTSTTYAANLPTHSEWYDGKQIILINEDATNPLIISGGAVEPNGTSYTSLAVGTAATLISIGGKWIIVAER